MVFGLRSRNMSRLSFACTRAGRSVIRVIAWIPVIFVAAVLLWGYYVYVYIINLSGTFQKGSAVVNVIISITLLLFGHILFALQLTSYLRTIFTVHKPIPEQFTLTESQADRLDDMDDEQALLRQLSRDLPVRQRSRSGGVRYCDSCDLLKPDRTHHCSMCNRCVLKMDHHCPWVNNCVGWSNYKFFVLFLFYTMLLCVYLASTSFYDFIRAWNGALIENSAHKFQVIFFMLVAALFGLSTSTLLIFHIYLSVLNRTTLENMSPPATSAGSDRRLYHLGVKENLKEVFGPSFLLGLLPVATSRGDGVSYRTKSTRGNIEMGVVPAPSDGSDSEHDETHPLTTNNI